jgi:hypothetical protein
VFVSTAVNSTGFMSSATYRAPFVLPCPRPSRIAIHRAACGRLVNDWQRV